MSIDRRPEQIKTNLLCLNEKRGIYITLFTVNATDEKEYINSGADPGFFLGGGALVSCSTSTPINHIVFFCTIPVVLDPPLKLSTRKQQVLGN